MSGNQISLKALYGIMQGHLRINRDRGLGSRIARGLGFRN